jgi:tRNA-dihydrouridine synthase B
MSEAPPLHIGPLLIDPPVILGPMAGYTTQAFRLLCRRAGAGLVCTEMISAKALQFGNTKTGTIMALAPSEHPVSMQIFGGEPDSMADAARQAVAVGADVVDINMGCTVPKVRRAQAGVSLLSDPHRAVAVARAVVQAVSVPVTVKFRCGMCVGDDDYLQLARRLEDVGVAALTLHARPANAYFRGHARWDEITRLVETVRIPVIGNGDVTEAGQVLQLLSQTGCAAVMIARGALGRPWLFTQVRQVLAGESPMPEPPGSWRLAVALCHAQLLALHEDELTAVREMRGQIGHYTHGLPHVSELRQRCQQVRTLAELAAAFTDYLKQSELGVGAPPGLG